MATQKEAEAVMKKLEEIIDREGWGMLRNFIDENGRWNLIVELLRVADEVRK